MNYRESIRALFEAVIANEINEINESNAARRAAKRALFARLGYKKPTPAEGGNYPQRQVKPEAKGKHPRDRETRDYMATRTGRKVRGQLDPYEEKGKITLDGPREYVFGRAEELPYNSQAGEKAREMKSKIKKRERDDAREAAAEERAERETQASVGRPSIRGAGREKAYPGER